MIPVPHLQEHTFFGGRDLGLFSGFFASLYLAAASVGYSGCVHGLLIVVASLAAKHSSRALKFQ